MASKVSVTSKAHLGPLSLTTYTVPDQYRNQLLKGDKVFFWKAAGKEGNSGIYALAK